MKRYVVSPAYMVWNKDNYYLLCFSNGYADLVTYRLDKMDDVKVDETEREPHPEYEKFNTDEYRKQVFSMFGGELCNVTLLFEPSILSDMFDRFGDDIRIRKVDDNAYSVDVSVQVSKTLFAWIVGTQGKVKIRSPKKVLDEFNICNNSFSSILTGLSPNSFALCCLYISSTITDKFLSVKVSCKALSTMLSSKSFLMNLALHFFLSLAFQHL